MAWRATWSTDSRCRSRSATIRLSTCATRKPIGPAPRHTNISSPTRTSSCGHARSACSMNARPRDRSPRRPAGVRASTRSWPAPSTSAARCTASSSDPRPGRTGDTIDSEVAANVPALHVGRGRRGGCATSRGVVAVRRAARRAARGGGLVGRRSAHDGAFRRRTGMSGCGLRMAVPRPGRPPAMVLDGVVRQPGQGSAARPAAARRGPHAVRCRPTVTDPDMRRPCPPNADTADGPRHRRTQPPR